MFFSPGYLLLFLVTAVIFGAATAHELGHAVQDGRGYLPMRARSAALPAANFGSQAGPMIIFLGLILMGFRAVNLAAIAVSALQVGFWALQVFGRRD